ncbi:MAG: efflux RND transporter permease subunit, partial [Desulfobulbaceae bacterium]
MKLTHYSLQNRTVTLILICLITLGGILSYDRLGRLEDPEFTIKEAVIYTLYPGAEAAEV